MFKEVKLEVKNSNSINHKQDLDNFEWFSATIDIKLLKAKLAERYCIHFPVVNFISITLHH